MKKAPSRYPIIDYWRGFFVVWMMVFHFCFLLADYRLVEFDFYRDPFWLHSRTIIVTGFLTLVGISLVLANRSGFNPKSYFRRLALLITYASLVSISTYIQVGERWVYFGILHFITVASLLGLPLVRFPKLSFAIGLFIVVIGNFYENEFFNQKIVNWIGLMTQKPLTNDYVPLFPWLGIVCIGIFIGNLLSINASKPRLKKLLCWHNQQILFKVLGFLGRQAIHVYIVHVPIFVAMIEVHLWLN